MEERKKLEDPGLLYRVLGLGGAGALMGGVAGGLGGGVGGLARAVSDKPNLSSKSALAKYLLKQGLGGSLKGAGVGALLGAPFLLAAYGNYKPTAYRDDPNNPYEQWD